VPAFLDEGLELVVVVPVAPFFMAAPPVAAPRVRKFVAGRHQLNEQSRGRTAKALRARQSF
jgi:hypothetical protein